MSAVKSEYEDLGLVDDGKLPGLQLRCRWVVVCGGEEGRSSTRDMAGLEECSNRCYLKLQGNAWEGDSARCLSSKLMASHLIHRCSAGGLGPFLLH